MEEGAENAVDCEGVLDSSDQDLMLLVKEGDRGAFTTLVNRYQESLLNFFRRMGDYNSADDLVQETFLRLFRYRDRYRPKAKLKSFIYLLARRAWIDHRRKQERLQRGYEKIAGESELQRVADAPSLEDAKSKVRLALDELSDEMRTVVVLSVYKGFKYREIAEILDIPLGTVKTRMFHALKKLKDILQDE